MKLIEVPDDVVAPLLARIGIKWTPFHRRMVEVALPGLANADIGEIASAFTQLMQDPVVGGTTRKLLAPATDPVELFKCPNCGWLHAPALEAEVSV